jgi:predicted kinase
MKELIILVGPPGSGKSTLAKSMTTHLRINQDDQGREGHMRYFLQAVAEGENIIVDRLNFNKEQREKYLAPAKANGYITKIVVLHESSETCGNRMLLRKDHPTIQDEKSARKALHMFMTKYEKPTQDEADEVEFRYPTEDKPWALITDLDGTLCDISHRQHLVQRSENKKPDWKAFFEAMDNDEVNPVVFSIIEKFDEQCMIIIGCSGRPDDYAKKTMQWLSYNNIPMSELFMRNRGDFRPDTVVKEIILDFELLTRYNIFFVLDDRDSVVKMWRSRGITCLQVAEGNF